MPGDRWRQMANLKAYLAFMWSHPGKKLIFMGAEIGQEREWNHDGEIDWDLLQQSDHAGLQRLVRDLNRLYASEPALHELDADPDGFQWLVGEDAANSVFAFLRRGKGEAAPLVFVVNFTPVPRPGYRIGAPQAGVWREVLNTDAEIYGGGNIGSGGRVHSVPEPAHGQGQSLELTLPPLGAVLLKPEEPA
jgi:1,4-alpha-glucan branching enzyme